MAQAPRRTKTALGVCQPTSSNPTRGGVSRRCRGLRGATSPKHGPRSRVCWVGGSSSLRVGRLHRCPSDNPSQRPRRGPAISQGRCVCHGLFWSWRLGPLTIRPARDDVRLPLEPALAHEGGASASPRSPAYARPISSRLWLATVRRPSDFSSHTSSAKHASCSAARFRTHAWTQG